MRRASRRLIGGIAVLLALLWTARPAPPEWSGRYRICERVALVERHDGAAVTGPEDIAYDPASGLVFVSAYDRRAAAPGDAGGGGIYAVALAALLAASGSVSVDRISRTVDQGGQFRPHGIDVLRDDDGLWLFAVLHRYAEGGTRLTRVARMRVLPGALEPAGQVDGSAVCRANDVVAVGTAAAIVSRTHGTCRPRWPLFGDAFDAASGRAARIGFAAEDAAPVPLADNLGHANGVARDADGTVYVAETRGGAVAVLAADGTAEEAAGVSRRLPLDGGPDNLSWTADGRLLTAVHPNLFRLALAFAGVVDRAPSDVVAIDPDGGAVETLFRDPSGRLVSAATAAVEAEGRLLIGSVLDDALVLCRGAAP